MAKSSVRAIESFLFFVDRLGYESLKPGKNVLHLAYGLRQIVVYACFPHAFDRF